MRKSLINSSITNSVLFTTNLSRILNKENNLMNKRIALIDWSLVDTYILDPYFDAYNNVIFVE